jgi:FecR protein
MSKSLSGAYAPRLLIAAVLAAFPLSGYAAPAARVDFSVGNVTALGANGKSRALAKGAQVEPGDTVSTNGGRAQLRFTDGAFVSLQPQSEFRIDEYKFDGKTDGSEKGMFSLLKGGLRTITGLVGRVNKKNYQITTSIATIGIRGTEYTLQFDDSITGTVGEGEIEVCNGGGCLNVTNGESYYVREKEVRPVISNKRTDLPPPEPERPRERTIEGENRDAGGNIAAGFLLTGRLANPGGAFNSGSSLTPAPALQAVFDERGNLTQIDGANSTVIPIAIINGENDGLIAWGAFVGSDQVTYAYAFGKSTDLNDLAGLQLRALRGNYALSPGATPVFNTSGAVIGSLNRDSTLVADFTSGNVAANMNWTINGRPVVETLTGNANTAGAFTLTSSGVSASVTGSGAFLGPNAARAGLVYSGSDTNGLWHGAAAFSQTDPSVSTAPLR